jgi:hypothetical protein
MSDIRSLVPQDKHDIERANAVIAAGYPAVASILPDLLEWLQDYNWPVAHVLAPFLLSIGSPLIPHISYVMDTDDEVWKYWMMGLIMLESREVALAFREELERIAYSPTEREILEELQGQAQRTLEEHGWRRAD